MSTVDSIFDIVIFIFVFAQIGIVLSSVLTWQSVGRSWFDRFLTMVILIEKRKKLRNKLPCQR